MDYPFYFNLCPDELELRRSLVVPEFVQSDHFTNSTLTKKLSQTLLPVQRIPTLLDQRHISVKAGKVTTGWPSWTQTNSLVYPKNDFKCTPDFALRTSDARINLDTYMHLYDF